MIRPLQQPWLAEDARSIISNKNFCFLTPKTFVFEVKD